MTNLAYFDNAATTFPKPDEVYSYADSFYRTCGGNAGRGNNTLAAAASSVARAAKENLKAMYSCPAKKVVFTASATEALNRVLLGLLLEKSDTVYITPFEHNAVTRPLNHLVKTIGINLEELPFDPITLQPNMKEIEQRFSDIHPKVVVMTHASNVCGAVVPVMEIAEIAKKYDAAVVVDMSQTCGLLPLELNSELIDYAIFAGHKTLYGPFGVGGFICKQDAQLRPILFGGNGVDSIKQEMPEDIEKMSEIGSQNVYAIAGLKASTDFLLQQGFDNLISQEREASSKLFGLLRECEIAAIVADDMRCDRVAIASVRFDGYSPDEVEMILSRYGVAVRAGLHCAPHAHRFLGTLPAGTVRFSAGLFSTDEEFTALRNALCQLTE